MSKVAVVLVTFNRATLLRRCLEALAKQTRLPDEVFVIDNCSTDDTGAVVESVGNTSVLTIRYERLAANLGGAGGFSYGCRQAFACGYDFMWLMDDDGVPEAGALEALLNCDRGDIRNALVLDIDNPARLAFGYKGFEGRDSAEAKASGIFLQDSVAPFNGTLVKRAVFQSIGFPFQEFFIWGDEIDFLARSRGAGFSCGTVTTAIHLHPADKKPIYQLLKRFTVATLSDERLPIYMRNYSANHWRFSTKRAWISFVIKQLTYEVFVKRSASRFSSALFAAVDGAFRFAPTVAKGATQPFEPDVDIATTYRRDAKSGLTV